MSILIENETTRLLESTPLGKHRVDDLYVEQLGCSIPCYEMGGDINTIEGNNRHARNLAVGHLTNAGFEPTEQNIQLYYDMVSDIEFMSQTYTLSELIRLFILGEIPRENTSNES